MLELDITLISSFTRLPTCHLLEILNNTPFVKTKINEIII